MRVLLVNQFFYPDVAPTGQLMTELACDLVRQGCRVSALAGHRFYAEKSGSLPRYEIYQGIEIFRVFSSHFGRGFLIGRLIDYWSFFIFASLRALRIKRPDVVICLSTPPWVSLIGLLLKSRWRCKFVSWVQDLYPEVAVKLGLLRERSWICRFLEFLSWRIFKRADRLVVLSSMMRDKLVKKGIPVEKVELIHNWADGKEIFPIQRSQNPLFKTWDLDGKFIVLYSGNMGRCHHFETLLPVVYDLRDHPGILFLFIGDGYGCKPLKDFKKVHGLSNLRFLPYQPKEKLAQSLSIGNVHLVTLRDGMEDLMVPSKIYAALAVGKPILYIGPENGEVNRVLEAAGCGMRVKMGDDFSLKEYILRLYRDPQLAQGFGEKAREFFERNFERKLSTHKFYCCLRQLLKV